MTRSLLIVDDEASMRRLYSRLFAGCGYDVRVAGTLAEAESLASGKRFDLVITDLNLPDGSGTEVIRAARKHGGAARAVLVSGSAEPRDLERLALRAGAQACFEKPFDPGALLAAAETLIK